MAKVQIVNPTAPEPAPATTGGRFSALPGSRVAVLENSKQHAELLLTEIARELGARHGVVHATTQHKSVAAPADPEVVDRLVEEADWVLVGSAD